MIRIRYIDDQLIARAFDRTFHRRHWDDRHGLADAKVAILTGNPQFEVESLQPSDDPSSGPVAGGTAG